ncbi:MAG: hypothetical protein AAFO03_27655 [Bacteroidota bacterium]
MRTTNGNHRKVLIVLLLIGTYIHNANACICLTAEFENEIKIADEIFLGKIMKAERYLLGKREGMQGEELAFWGWRYYFEVEKKWKGNNQSEFIIEDNGSSCSSRFDVFDEKILVYARRGLEIRRLSKEESSKEEGTEIIHTSVCSRTVHSESTNDDSWYQEDIGRLNQEFLWGIDLESVKEKNEGLVTTELNREKIFKPMIFVVTILVILNLFQLISYRVKSRNA